MKKLFTLTLCALGLSSFAQIHNPNFSGLNGWYTSNVKGASYAIDSSSNQSSLKLVGTEPGAVPTFSQRINYPTGAMKLITLSALVKTIDVQRGISLWCQIWDDQKQIGFSNSSMQSAVVKGDHDWKDMSIKLLLPANTQKLVIGGYLLGKGTSWFTNVKITEKTATTTHQGSLAYIDEVKQLIKKNSLYKDSIKWELADQELRYLGHRLDSTDFTLVNQYFINILRNVGDKHSFFQDRDQATSYANGNTVAVKPESRLIESKEGKIGYIKVPAFGSVNSKVMTQFADTIQNMIKALDEQNPSGWIVDLRGNGGGNMYPMIAGLGPLIGTGKLGYFVGQTKTPWSYDKNGSSGAAKVTKAYQLKSKEPKISVLIDSKTGSSGEMTAISFIGKPNVKIFGQPSAGYTTANQSMKLSDGGMLLLATTYVADRKEKKYLAQITPDVLIDATDTEDLAISKAATWLSKK